MAIDEIREKIEQEYLPRARWWPWKNELRRVDIQTYECTSKLHYLLLRHENQLFQLPLIQLDEIPLELKPRGFCVNGKCFVEAEYTPWYLGEFLKLSMADYRQVSTPIGDFTVQSARPLTMESTNAIAVYETSRESMVLKSYRLIPGFNIEAKILEHLGRRNYRYIPRVHGILTYRNEASGILMSYVKGVGDGGTPFYNSLVDYLKTHRDSYEIGLAAKLGVVIAELHIYLNTDPPDEFFGVEEVNDRDLAQWTSRIEKMYIGALRRLDEVLPELEEPEHSELNYWRSIAERAGEVVEDAIDKIQRLYASGLKARIHQDLHLGQMIYTGDNVLDFVITDFEGEPGRSTEERLMKEPLLRDLASMIRSFHYLSHAAIMNSMDKTRHEASLVMARDDPSLEWRFRHVVSMTYSYLARMWNTPFMGSIVKSPSGIWPYLYPWIIERAVYEFYYESHYRPLWCSIPIVGLLEAKRYLLIR